MNTDLTRAARLQAIRDNALVRAALGQAAGYVLVDGVYKITLPDPMTKIVTSYTAATLAEAITKAKNGRESR
jgi:hypothetical protein